MNNNNYKKIKTLQFLQCLKPKRDPTFDDIYCECEKNELACNNDICINKKSLIQCNRLNGKNIACENNSFSKKSKHSLEVIFINKMKNHGVVAKQKIEKGAFIIEYIGEVIDKDEKKKRKNTTYTMKYFKNDFFIDAQFMGNESRFINHSCKPNAEIQSWLVNGILRVGIFSLTKIDIGEEVTICYNSTGNNNPCFCGEVNCNGFF